MLLMQVHLWTVAGWTMIHFFWVGGAIGLLAALGRRLLRPAGAQARYLFLLICFLALLAAPLAIGRRLVQEASGQAIFGGSHPSAASAEPASGARPAESRARLEDPGSRSGPRGTVGARLPRAAYLVRLLSPLAARLPWVWLLGTPLALAWVLLGLFGAEGLRRKSRALEDPALLRLVATLEAAYAPARRLSVAICDRIASPILVGILRPAILLPPAVLTGFSVEQVEMVLLHELAHLRRLDNLVNLLQWIVEALLFFHPMVWQVSAWVRMEREAACDDFVLARTGKPILYARSLAAFTAPGSLPADAAALSGSFTLERIRRILRPDGGRLRVSRAWVPVFAVLLLLPFMAWTFLHGASGTASASPFSFLRFSDEGEGKGRLLAAVSVYQGPEGVEVLLVTEFPYAQSGYYQQVNQLLAPCETVLHRRPYPSRKSDQEPARRGFAERALRLSYDIQDSILRELLDLEDEGSAVARPGDRFVDPIAQGAGEEREAESPEREQSPVWTVMGDLAYLAGCLRNDVQLFGGYLAKRWGLDQAAGEKGTVPAALEAGALSEARTAWEEMSLKFIAEREMAALWEAAWPPPMAPVTPEAAAGTAKDSRVQRIISAIPRPEVPPTVKVALYFQPGILSDIEARLAGDPRWKNLRKEWLPAWEAGGE
jgi:beta-lactamase regulating signal transducer with metallopeptidase domain